MLNLANTLTLLRLALLPVIIALLFQATDWAVYCALALYALGAFTDWLDGYVARNYNQITAFGTFLDPISDKIYVASIMITLVAIGAVQEIGIVFIILIFVREFTISGLREYLGPHNVQVPVTKLAKWKTTIQMVATGFLMVWPLFPYGYAIGLTLLGLATALTLITAAGYLRVGFAHMQDEQ